LFILVDLRNELTKEQDSRQKLEQDILELRRVRSISTKYFFSKKNYFIYFLSLDVLIKKLKRLNRSSSSTTGNCSNSKGDTKSKK
jgi:hypothetical protein